MAAVNTIAQKSRVSLVMDFEKKQALEQLAKRQNRTLNYLIGELVDKALQEVKEQEEYEAYVEKRVMQAYQNVLDGKKGTSVDDCFAAVREHGKQYAQAKGKL